MDDLFRADNTEGYNEAELAALNSEWHQRVEAEGLDLESDEWYAAAKAHADAVARR